MAKCVYRAEWITLAPKNIPATEMGNRNGAQKTEDGSQSAKGYLEIKKSLLSKLEG